MNGNIMLDTCCKKPCVADYPRSYKKEKKMSHNNMHIEVVAPQPTYNELPTDQKQREYLLGRLSEAENDLEALISKTFNIHDQDPPTTRKELAARLTDGMYIINQLDKLGDEQIPWYTEITCLIRWRDPSKPADEAGAKTAREELNKMFNSSRDQIVISEPADGLTALQKFQAWTPTVTTTTAQ